MVDIHNYEKKVKSTISNIQSSSSIFQENKEDCKQFTRWMKTKKDMSPGRIVRYLQSFKQVAEYNNFRLKEAEEKQIEQIAEQIKDSAYYSQTYSPETKREYRKFVRTFYKWAGGQDKVPVKANFLKLSIKEKDKERTHPRDLPKPRDIKLMAQHMENLRDVALLLGHWDLGSRIEETLSTKIRDYWEEDGVHYIQVHGNKDSPDRTCRVDVAYPAIDRWLEQEHPCPDDPEAYLFCRINGRKKESKEKIAKSYASYRNFLDVINEANEKQNLTCERGTHIIRKGRITFLKNLGVPESDIDKRVGHIPGSEVTREYTRISDTDANSSYAQAYGNGAGIKVEDIVPLKCQECGTINSGHRDRCHRCNTLLEITEVRESKEKGKEIKELLYEVLKDKGMLEPLLQEADRLMQD